MSTTDVDQAARVLAGAYVVKVAEQMAADAQGIKEGAGNRARSGCSNRDVQARLDLAEAFVSAEMKLRERARQLTGRYPHWTGRRPAAEAVALFDVDGAA